MLTFDDFYVLQITENCHSMQYAIFIKKAQLLGKFDVLAYLVVNMWEI